MAILNIDGTDVEVMDYQWLIADQDLDSGRNLAGYMERNVLDHSANVLTIVFPPQYASQRRALLRLLHKKQLSCTFLSPLSNTMETHIMYHNDLESALYWNPNDSIGNEVLYNAFQVKLIEY